MDVILAKLCNATGLPETITDGLRITYNNNYYVGDKILYDCNLGSFVNGTPNQDIQQYLECQPDGTWLTEASSPDLAPCEREYN